MFGQNIVCPVSGDKIDNNAVRITAFTVLLLLALFLFTANIWAMYILCADFLLRSGVGRKYSPLRWLALNSVSVLKINAKYTDAAQKIFSARLGFLFTLIIIALWHLGFATTSYVLSGMLVVLASLEAFCSYCVGCIIYNYIVLPIYNQKTNS